jgi:tRNA(fMet)-specific endonuclease VapC
VGNAKPGSPRHLQGLIELLSDVTILAVDGEVARRFGEVRAGLLDRGRPVSGMDLLIGATALVHGLTVVTHNTQDFTDIPGLAVVDWLTG